MDRGESLGPVSWLFRSRSRWVGKNMIRKVSRSTPGLCLSISRAGEICTGSCSEAWIAGALW